MNNYNFRLLELEDSKKNFEKVICQLKKSNKNINNNSIKCNNFINIMLNSLNNIARCYVIEENNKIIGTGTIYYQPKLHRNTNNIEYGAFIEDVVVSDTYRRKGLGKILINFLIEKCKNPDIKEIKNIYKITLNCSDDLIPFYEKCNFTKINNQMIYLL